MPGQGQSTGVLERFGRGVYAARDLIAWGWLIAIIACLPLSATAVSDLTAGGMMPPGESRATEAELVERFGLPVSTATFLIADDPDTVDAAIANSAAEIMGIPHVQGAAAADPARDGAGSALTIGFSASPDTAQDSLAAVTDALEDAGLSVDGVAGLPALYVDIAKQTEADLIRAEAIGIPAAMIVLVAVFGSLVAASAPLAVGIASVIVTTAIVHLVALVVPVSIYSLNIAAMLGLGIGIDYSLLAVARFRESLARGADVRDAVVETVVHAGRATAVSGLAVAAGAAALAVIPIPMLRSIALAGVIVVAVAVTAALTLLPALLGLLGERVGGASKASRSERWEQVVAAVMRRPVAGLCGGLILLALLAAPAADMRLDMPHSDVLRSDAPSRVASSELAARFGESAAAPTLVVADIPRSSQQDAYRTALERLDGVTAATVLARDPHGVAIAVTSAEAPEGGPAGRELADRIRAVPVAGASTPPRLSGQAPGETEFLAVMETSFGPVVLLVVAATFVVLLIAFRSLLIPLKALILGALSIAAALGVVVAVFEAGTGAGIVGAETLGYTVATLPVILFCVLFGLSMDYEVFMLARVAESHEAGASASDATLDGVARTAPLVTGAALILVVVGLGFATAEIVIVKQIGVALAVALAIDATVIRVLLVPAALRLAGEANWWLPAPLAAALPGQRWAAESMAAPAVRLPSGLSDARASATIFAPVAERGRFAS